MRKIFSKMDIPLFLAVTILSLFGAVMIYSASSVSTILRYDLPTWNFFIKQLLFIVMTYILGFVLILRYPTKKYNIWRSILLVVMIASLIGLFIFAGFTNDARSWYTFNLFSIQPSEFAKSIVIILSAIYYNKLNKKNVTFKRYLPILGIGALAAFLVAAQPDLGSAIILAGITFMMFMGTNFVRKNFKKVMVVVSMLVLAVLVIFFAFKEQLLTDNQLSRFVFANPCSRITESTGYQVCNGFIAINNGGWFGVGFGNSTQKYLYLPESHTDFIFPIIVEEVGYIAGIGIIIAYIIILWRIIKIARESHNMRCSMLAYGTFWFISLHIIVNLYGVLALFPLTGVPLPFLSYGGSSIINFLVMIFIVLRVSIENKEESYKKELSKLT